MAFDGGFTPRQFPIDPFDAEVPSTLPWSLDPHTLPDGGVLAKQRSVVLVLGEPPLDAIAPLLHSQDLAASLVILATTRAYLVPPTATPAVRILRLGVSLASSESGASRLAAILQWADRIAAAWRATPGAPAFEELPEEGPTAGYQTPPQRSSWFGSPSSSALPSPASSDLALSLSRKQTPPRRSSTPDPPLRAPTQRAFDALLDFLPPDAPDRHLLKHAILVTTIARPFLAAPAADPPPLPSPSRRFSSIRGRPPPPPPEPSAVPPKTGHIVHLIPPARAALIRPLESFCLSFSFPARGTLDAPRPYIMPPAALGDVFHFATRRWTIAELVLCGALDGEPTRTASLRSLAKTNRAWLKGGTDVVLTTGPTKRLNSAPTRPVMQPQPRAAPQQPFFAAPDELGALPTHMSARRWSTLRAPSSAPTLAPRHGTPAILTRSLSSPMGKPVKSAWPTPPSSASSASTSPSSSPELRGVGESKSMSKSKDATAVPPWDGTQKRKRRGLLAWIKR